MATFADFSTTPADNTSIGGVDVDENCTPAGINNAIRELMAACKTFDNGKADGSLYVLKSASVLSTNVIVEGRGAGLHHNNPGNASGRFFIQASGDSAPSMSDGDFLFEV